jgi:hypothetical protein
MKFALYPHPAYNLDLAPSVYHIFRLLKDALCGCQFANGEVKDMVCGFIHNQKHSLQMAAGSGLK